MRVVVVLGACGLLSACGRAGFDPLARADAMLEPEPDGAVDGANDSIQTDALACFGTGLYTLCPQVVTPGTIVLPTLIDTDASPLCGAYTGTSDSLCVIAATTLLVSTGAVVAATGSRPLVLIGTENVDIDGTLDVASHRAGRTGPGATGNACMAGTAPMDKLGGPGGSFGGTGGAGGGPVPSGAGVTGVASLRGGCAGSDGSGGTQGTGGAGGGAVYVMAGASVIIEGTVNASGAGGGGALDTAGGGGGGSGGMIVLDAPLVTLAASSSVFANGGGGGEAAGNSNSGNPGADPASALTRASGGAGGAGAGDGGSGSAGSDLTGVAGLRGGSAEGGGGGGGAGLVRVFSPQFTQTGALSPPST